MQPTLYIVSTPIGTLNDLSLRAQEVLSSVDFVICEDTRQTRKLLSYFKIQAQLKSLNLQNEKDKSEFIIENILNSPNKSAALVSDAGTPGLSDPGAILIAAAHASQIKVLSVPGPSSLTSAVAACGFLEPRMIFSGFLGRTKKSQNEEFKRWESISPCVAVFFESPKRVIESLKNVSEFFADKTLKICVSKEISKKFEEHLVGFIEEITEQLTAREQIQGEFVVCVQIKNKASLSSNEDLFSAAFYEAIQLVAEGKHYKDACKEMAKKYLINAKDLYNKLILHLKK